MQLCGATENEDLPFQQWDDWAEWRRSRRDFSKCVAWSGAGSETRQALQWHEHAVGGLVQPTTKVPLVPVWRLGYEAAAGLEDSLG